MIDEKVRARVLEVDGEVATLGIYVQGTWARIHARTEVPLVTGSWLYGRLVVPPDGSMVFFRLLDESPGQPEAVPPPPNGLDLEA